MSEEIICLSGHKMNNIEFWGEPCPHCLKKALLEIRKIIEENAITEVNKEFIYLEASEVENIYNITNVEFIILDKNEKGR